MATNDDIIAMCATTQADVRNICNTLDNIKQYIGNNIEQHSITNSRLAVIERVQNDMTKNMATYQEDCTKGRGDHDRRLTAVEGFQRNQIKVAGAVGGGIAFLIAGGIKVLDRIFL